MIRPAAFIAALVLGAAAASAAPTAQDSVAINFSDFGPAQITVLRGDAVRWTNQSVRRHTVTAEDGSFDSGSLYTGDHFERSFDSDGRFGFYCTVHPSMRGEVDVYDVLLNPEPVPLTPGAEFQLTGRTVAAPGTPVSVQTDDGAEAATATVGDDGTFAATVAATTTTDYHAVAGGSSSPPVQVVVLDRSISAHAVRRGIRVDVTPASPGDTVVLQLHLKERFGWWPVRRIRLHGGSDTIRLPHLSRRVSARAVLTLPDGATPLATSPTLRVGPAARKR